jgi:glycosyltransferase involved in cell wall biosynthesis
MVERLTLISQYAFYPMHWEAFRVLCTEYAVQGSVISPPLPEMPLVHKQLGWVSFEDAKQELFRPDVRQIPKASRRRQRNWLCEQLDDIRPDAIWVQEEPTNRLLIDVLRHFRHDRKPRIVCAVAENIFRIRWWRRWLFARHWQRLNGMLAVAGPSVQGIQRAGMPRHIPADTLVAGAQAPDANVQPMQLPLQREGHDWVTGFAGRICPEKGWNVLLDAIELLPHEFKVVLAGDGPQRDQLQRRLEMPALRHRAAYLGLLPKSELWRLYKAVDCLATPHLTFPHWKEQFGGVLADAMAVGLPIVGSDSGAIPEVVGGAGLIVPENNAPALAAAIRRLHEQPALAKQLSSCGTDRFANEFAIPAYARKIARALQLNLRRSSMNVAAA